jgi:glycosyltransferase involved in cell wall biosynthesis
MPKPRTALLVNFVAPYRVRVFERLAAAVDLIILHGDVEGNRAFWKETKVNGACDKRVAGWQLSFNKRRRGKAIDHWFLHIEPGYITELIRERPDAVITSEMGFRTLVALAYGACFRKPVWVWWGGTRHTERYVGRFRKLLRGLIALWAKRWISYGQTSTAYLLTLGIARERILQVQNCVDESWYVTPTEPAFEVRPQPIVLHVGRMIAGKGVAEFLRAAARLQQEGLSFSVVLVGGGRDTVKQQQLAAEVGLENIHFFPTQPPNAMPGFYRSADVLIFPTMSDVWGLVANEAVLSGVPVLCSRYAGCAPELFDPVSIFDPADEEQFLTALRRAVAGQLPRADRTRLWSSVEVGDAIANAVLASYAGKQLREPRVKAGEMSRPVPGRESGR